MARLYDKIMTKQIPIAILVDKNTSSQDRLNKKSLLFDFYRWFDDCVVVEATNVEQYVDSQYGSEMGVIKLPSTWKDMNILPPFEHMLIEFETAEKHGTIGYVYKEDNTHFNVAIFTSAFKGKNFVLTYLQYVEVDENGIMLDIDLLRHESLQDTFPIDIFLTLEFVTIAHALAFFNTKNVEIIENVPPKGKNRKHIRRYGRPLVTYKTIKVNPMSKRYADTGDDEPSEGGIPSRLHICRGHFKDFRHGAGLFGKYKDIFWWDQHLRGDVHEGVVVNDYEVEAPLIEHMGS